MDAGRKFSISHWGRRYLKKWVYMKQKKETVKNEAVSTVELAKDACRSKGQPLGVFLSPWMRSDVKNSLVKYYISSVTINKIR